MPLDTPSSVLLKPLTFVTAVHEIRPLNTAYVKRLQQKICAIGVKPYPLSVTPAGVLFGGRHRYEAFKAEGITECLMHISEPASLDREANAVITDPPYRISTDRVYRLASQADWSKNFGAWDNLPEGEFLADIRRWAAAFFRVMKPGASGFMFVGEPYINIAQALFDAAGFEIKGSFFWCRSNPGTSVTKADFMPAMDHAIQFMKPGARRTFNYPGEPEGFNWFRSPICGGHERLRTPKGETLHPTQKPEAVIRHLMDLITLPGDLVLDGFMGTGTTGKVARDTGRRFIGIERDDAFFTAAKARVEG